MIGRKKTGHVHPDTFVAFLCTVKPSLKTYEAKTKEIGTAKESGKAKPEAKEIGKVKQVATVFRVQLLLLFLGSEGHIVE